MANQDHVRLFARGVANWNRCRDENPFEPDLSGVRLGGQPPGNPELPPTFADLAGVNLQSADLRGTSLGNSNLTDADLSYANLEGANLMAADLTGANLFEARVGNADLRFANLSYAQLYHTDLTGALLKDAKLSHARKLPASLWHAKLFDSPELHSQPTIEVTHINSVSCLLDNISRIRAGLSETEQLFFRGESKERRG